MEYLRINSSSQNQEGCPAGVLPELNYRIKGLKYSSPGLLSITNITMVISLSARPELLFFLTQQYLKIVNYYCSIHLEDVAISLSSKYRTRAKQYHVVRLCSNCWLPICFSNSWTWSSLYILKIKVSCLYYLIFLSFVKLKSFSVCWNKHHQ